MHGAGFSDCELVFVNKDFKTSTITRLNDIHITRGRIVAATLFITPAMKLAMGDLATHPEANWVNQ